MNKQQINQAIWRACENLRGTVNPEQYQDYVLHYLMMKHKDGDNLDPLRLFMDDNIVDWERVGVDRIVKFIDDLSIVDDLDNDELGDIYEYMLQQFASSAGKKGGEFFTPPEVSQLLAMILNPQPFDKCYDPTCGSGSLLLRLDKYTTSLELYGQEINSRTFNICKWNMGINDAKHYIKQGDTLRDPQFFYHNTNRLMQFDIIAANPPFSLNNWWGGGQDKWGRFHRGMPPKSKGDYAFISHIIESLGAYGKAAIILPHGVLFRGSSEGAIRQSIIEENLIDAVIGLPPNLFYNTSIPTVVIVISRDREHKDVLFIDASSYFEQGKQQNKLISPGKITETYSSRVVVDKFSYIATFEEIKDNSFNLNITRYVDTFEPEEPVNIRATQDEIDELETLLVEKRKQMNHILNDLI